MHSGLGANAPPRNDKKAVARAAAFLPCGIDQRGTRSGLVLEILTHGPWTGVML
jgi:hypothetical protein